MKNPDYSPETAHLPSNEDKIRWKKGLREKHLKQEKILASTIKRFQKYKND